MLKIKTTNEVREKEVVYSLTPAGIVFIVGLAIILLLEIFIK